MADTFNILDFNNDLRGALVVPSGTVTLIDNQTNIVPFTVVEYDRGGWYDPGDDTRLTVPEGVEFAIVTARCELTALTVGFQRNEIQFNGSALFTGNDVNEFDVSFRMGQTQTAILPVKGGDFFELAVTLLSLTGNKVVNNNLTWFNIAAFRS